LNKPYSLRARLLISATLVLMVFLGLMGFVLDRAFQKSAEQAVQEKLLIQIYGLLAVSDESDGEIYLPDQLQEPQFNSLGSGLYGLVIGVEGQELWQSPSALDLQIKPADTNSLHLDLKPGVQKFGRVQGNGEDWLFFLSYKILWQGKGEQSTPYIFIVLENMQPFDKEIAGFRNSLWGWLLAVVVILVVVQAAIMSWGLKPLHNLADDLKAIEDGKEDYLRGEYPVEIDGVTRNLNLLLSSERQQREKYRTTLADLAHSLKTPLAILQGAPAENIRETIDEQIPRMNEIVSYQLQRAVTKSASLIRKSIEVKPVADKLVAAITRVYEEKSVEIESTIMDCNFFGDERDLMELLGNVLDNACKYGNGRVKMAVGNPGETTADLLIVVEDDGEGIAMADRDTVLLRGERLDTKMAGQGIGLAVVSEIVDRYSGEIEVDESILGGARVTIKLP
tara:strand:- start:288 stop:1640 length:1353 start_codon:yes stop_codon:yes gene_type:complete